MALLHGFQHPWLVLNVVDILIQESCFQGKQRIPNYHLKTLICRTKPILDCYLTKNLLDFRQNQFQTLSSFIYLNSFSKFD